jgi:hypothetical protein
MTIKPQMTCRSAGNMNGDTLAVRGTAGSQLKCLTCTMELQHFITIWNTHTHTRGRGRGGYVIHSKTSNMGVWGRGMAAVGGGTVKSWVPAGIRRPCSPHTHTHTPHKIPVYVIDFSLISFLCSLGASNLYPHIYVEQLILFSSSAQVAIVVSSNVH